MAAEIATMRVTEQIDALGTLGTRPMQYLIAPKIIASLICIPVLDTMDEASQAKFKELSKPFTGDGDFSATEPTSCRSLREDGTYLDATMTLSAATYDGESCLQIIIRTAFNQRRKTLKNSLKAIMPATALNKLPIDTSLRPESLSLKDYAMISDVLSG